MKFILILLFPFLMKGQIDDKTLHFYSGFLISNGVGYGVYKKTHKIGLSILSGIGSGMLAGWTKELYDREIRHTKFDNEDLKVTCWGAYCGGVSLTVIIDLDRKKEQRLHPELYESY